MEVQLKQRNDCCHCTFFLLQPIHLTFRLSLSLSSFYVLFFVFLFFFFYFSPSFLFFFTSLARSSPEREDIPAELRLLSDYRGPDRMAVQDRSRGKAEREGRSIVDSKRVCSQGWNPVAATTSTHVCVRRGAKRSGSREKRFRGRGRDQRPLKTSAFGLNWIL